MAINYTSLLKLPKPDVNTAAWATYMHRLADVADLLAGQVATVTKVTGATTFADLDGTADKGKYPIIRSTVTLTGAVTVNVPARDRLILAENFTGGTGTWKIQTSGGNGVIVPKNKRMWLRSTSTGVIPVSRTDGRSTATETGLAIITASNIATDAITTAKITDANVTLLKLAGGASYGRIMYTATTAGFAWTTLARGTANQELAMSTGTNTKPAWRDSPFRKTAFSTGKSFSNGSIVSYTHGITGISNKYDYRSTRVLLECLSTDAGYSAGDCILVSDCKLNSGVSNGVTVVFDSVTIVKVVVASAGIQALNKSTEATTTLSASDWVMRIGVYV